MYIDKEELLNKINMFLNGHLAYNDIHKWLFDMHIKYPEIIYPEPYKDEIADIVHSFMVDEENGEQFKLTEQEIKEIISKIKNIDKLIMDIGVDAVIRQKNNDRKAREESILKKYREKHNRRSRKHKKTGNGSRS